MKWLGIKTEPFFVYFKIEKNHHFCNMKNKAFSLAHLLFVITTLTLFSCTQQETDLVDLGEAKIRIINASPENATISVTVNDTIKTPQPLSFTQSTGYLNIGAGNIQVRTNSNRITASNSSINLLFKNGKNYTVFVAGKISKDSLIYITLEDNFVGVNDTTARVRFVNASPNSTNLEAVFSKSLIDSTANFTSTAFRTSSVYQAFRPGIYNIKVRTSISTLNLAVGSNYNVIAGKYYTIWIKGLRNETGTYALSPVLLTDN